METNNNRLIVVLGMHRSGTSAVTRGLQVLRVSLGDRMMPPAEGNNAKGFWEDIDLNALNIQMLAAVRSDWSYLTPIETKDVETLRNAGYFLRAVELLRQKVGGVAVFGFKDPRVAKLLPFWKEVFVHCQFDVSYVLTVRHPLSVTRSLIKRDGLPAEKCYLLWLEYVLKSLADSAGCQRVLVDYDLLMKSPDHELGRLATQLDLTLDAEELQNYKTGFLDQSLRHTVYQVKDLLLESSCPPLVQEIYTTLLNVAMDRIQLDAPAMQKTIELWTTEFNRSHTALKLADKLDAQKVAALQTVVERDGQIASLNQGVVERDGQIASLNQGVVERDGQIASLNQGVVERDGQIAEINRIYAEALGSIDEIRASSSWRITAPLRFVSTKAKNIVSVIRLLPRIYRVGGGAVGVTKKAWRAFTHEGWAGVKRRIIFVAQGRSGVFGSAPVLAKNEENDYGEWVRRYDTLTDEDRKKIKSRIDGLPNKPLFSVVMPVYNPPILFFEKAIQSVRNQLYPNWELCIADDASTDPLVRKVIERHCKQDKRIKVIYRTENGHISRASNNALELAHGDFVAMFDHDDAIPEHALYLFAEELNRNPEVDFLYSDQDKIDTNDVRYDPYFKPDFNPDLLRSQNFVDHLAVFRTSIVRELGGWRTEFDGSQDYDLVLRVTERMSPSRIRHIPYVLYHWRAVPGSLAIDSGAKNYAPITSRKALADHLKRLGIQAEVTSQYPHLSIHRVIYPLADEPLVIVIIPTKDGVDILSQCIDGLLNKTDYKNFEIIIVNNQSEEPATHTYLEKLSADPRIRVIDFNEPFNYSKINNIAARAAKGSVLALLNNDIEIINRDWLREMVSHAVRPEIGAVGARLFYPDGTVQHAGVLLGYKGRAGHMYRYASADWLGYWARGVLIQNLTAVTAACMVLRKELFESVGGFDEENFTVTFNDVDLCLRIHEKGYRNLYTPYAELYHHESKTRGLLAFQSEEDYFALRWKPYIENDPAYNPNLSLTSENFALAYPPRVSRPWMEQGETPSQNGTPLVTIITRTHGERHEFLRQSLASVFRQTYRPIQIVVVEDGGDNMRSLLDTITPPAGITVDYESLPKRGRCYAGNRGLELAQGKLFGFLDDDDLFLPDHVESLVQCLNANPLAVGAYSCAWEIPTDVISLAPLQYVEGRKRLFGRADWSLSRLWSYNYITIQSLLLKKELYLKYGGLNEELDCLEDWDLWLRYTAEGNLAFLDKPTSEFRIPKTETVLQERRKEHMRYLPILRNRQKELLNCYKNTPYYERLRTAAVDAG